MQDQAKARALEAVQRLANVPMELSLEQWQEICRDLLAGINAPSHVAAQGDEALEEFDRLCRFIDGMHMGGFVENDFMSKPVQKIVRKALISAATNPDDKARDIITPSEVMSAYLKSNALNLDEYFVANGLRIVKGGA